MYLRGPRTTAGWIPPIIISPLHTVLKVSGGVLLTRIVVDEKKIFIYCPKADLIRNVRGTRGEGGGVRKASVNALDVYIYIYIIIYRWYSRHDVYTGGGSGWLPGVNIRVPGAYLPRSHARDHRAPIDDTRSSRLGDDTSVTGGEKTRPTGIKKAKTEKKNERNENRGIYYVRVDRRKSRNRDRRSPRPRSRFLTCIYVFYFFFGRLIRKPFACRKAAGNLCGKYEKWK